MLIYEIEKSIAEGKPNADLIPWSNNALDLFGPEAATPESSIEAFKRELCTRGWSWSHSHHDMRCNGWKVWFRSQGFLSPPIAQWSKIESCSPANQNSDAPATRG